MRVRPSGPAVGEWLDALRWILMTSTLLAALAICGSFASYQRVTTRGHPWLPRVQCRGCMLCGMTRSFCAMSHGHLAEASRWNRGGPFLYFGSWVLMTGGSVMFIPVAGRSLSRFARRPARGFHKPSGQLNALKDGDSCLDRSGC